MPDAVTPAKRPGLVSRVVRRFYKLPMRNRLLLIEAVMWLAGTRLAMLFVPFKVLAARFGTVKHPNDKSGVVEPELSQTQTALAHDIGWAVTRAARYVPFRAVCLPQAIAAKAMLSRRAIPSVMHFGVAKGETELAAHAWLDVGRIEVTGFPIGADLVEVARFV